MPKEPASYHFQPAFELSGGGDAAPATGTSEFTDE